LLRRWRKKISSWPEGGAINQEILKSIEHFFSNDLDTRSAILLLRTSEKDGRISDAQKRATFLAADVLLGLDLARQDDVALPEELMMLLNERQQARQTRDWARSDKLRELLLQKGVRVEDGPDGQIWEILSLTD
jgi:cysteinyl-tRNA synthetase